MVVLVVVDQIGSIGVGQSRALVVERDVFASRVGSIVDKRRRRGTGLVQIGARKVAKVAGGLGVVDTGVTRRHVCELARVRVRRVESLNGRVVIRRAKRTIIFVHGTDVRIAVARNGVVETNLARIL